MVKRKTIKKGGDSNKVKKAKERAELKVEIKREEEAEAANVYKRDTDKVALKKKKKLEKKKLKHKEFIKNMKKNYHDSYDDSPTGLNNYKNNVLIHLLAEKKGIKYIPYIRKPDSELRIASGNIGMTLKDNYKHRKRKKGKKETRLQKARRKSHNDHLKKKYNRSIKKLNKIFYKDTGFWHNNINYDTVFIKGDKLRLVNFNNISKTREPTDEDDILYA
jgi:hypothetical protein